MDYRNDSNYGYSRNISLDYNLLNNGSVKMFKFRYKNEYFTFEGYTFKDAINDMDLMLNLNGKNNWVQSQYEPQFYTWRE